MALCWILIFLCFLLDVFPPQLSFSPDAIPLCNANFTSKSFLVLGQLYSQGSFWGNENWKESEVVLVHTLKKKDNVCWSLSSLMMLGIILLATVSLLLKKKRLTHEFRFLKIFGYNILELFFFPGNRDNWNVFMEIGTTVASSKPYWSC